MSNTIELKRLPGLSLTMSNGGTSVFINAFGLSGSRIAKTEHEKTLITFLLEKDQSALGLGMIYLDIGDMPWDYNNFENDKTFILSVIEGMKNKSGWETLSFTPNEEFLNQYIQQFEEMILQMEKSDINTGNINKWLKESKADDPANRFFPLCDIHNVFLTIHGCHVCNDC
jgi:hypothetical protein